MPSHLNKVPDLSPYRAISTIGEGGTGCVYLAEEPESPVQVALKVLHPEFLEQRALVNDFFHTVTRVGALGHVNIVKVLRAGFLYSGRPFVAMEYLPGRDLGDLLAREGTLDYRKVIHLVRQICAGLGAAHREGFLHLDIKPNNIFISGDSSEYSVKLLDFGSAKLFSASGKRAGGGGPDRMVLGTPEYWSPEQACGQALDQRSDIYSLGVVMYESLSGKTPFWSHSVSDVIAQHVRCEPAGLIQQPNAGPIPEPLVRLVLRCLKKEPDKRFQSMEELAEALSAVPLDSGGERRIAVRVCPTCQARFPAGTSYCGNDGARLSEVCVVSDRHDDGEPGEIGAVFGSYRLVKLLGEGGMGRVYLAEHVRLGRKVAMKMLRPEYAGNREAVARFFREARSVNRINHENIVEITDFVEEEGGRNYYIMELLEGRNLGDLMRSEGRLPISRVLGIAAQISKALSAAHKAGVVHRDLKTENIFLIERGGRTDFVKLLDFGVAKLMEVGKGQSIHKTAAGILIGTPEYMAPEQAGGGEVDYRSDIYSLGVILFEMATGRNPFSDNAQSFGDVLVRHLTLKPPRPSTFVDKSARFPKQFEDLILRCLEKDPRRRPQKMSDVEEQLRQIADQESFQLESYVSRTFPRRRRLGMLISIGAVGAALVGGALSFEIATSEKKDLSRPTVKAPVMPKASPNAKTSSDVSANRTVKITFDSSPQGAEVYIAGDDRPLGSTPFELSLTRSSRVETFHFRMLGYDSVSKQVSLDIDAPIVVSLTRAEPIEKKSNYARARPKRKLVETGAAASKRRSSRRGLSATVDPFAEDRQ